jgi:anti-sigma regulatory factor (Ser/Thr protein kinase)
MPNARPDAPSPIWARDVLRPTGDLDATAVREWAARMAARRHPTRLDLSDITFVDVAGLRELRAWDPAPVVVAASPAVRRLIELLGWEYDPCAAPCATLRHELHAYDDDAGLTDRIAPFLAAGVEAGEAVVAVLDRRKCAVLRRELRGPGGRITFLDRDRFYTRPIDAIAAYHATVGRFVRNGAPSVRVFGEPPLCETAAEQNRWASYEAVLNRAFARHPIWAICGYDTREVAPGFVRDARCTHYASAPPRDSAVADPAPFLRERAPEPEALPELRSISLAGGERATRRRLGRALAEAGASERTRADLLLATTEVLDNAHRHGRGPVRFGVGRAGARMVCAITDAGPGIDDPLAGWVPPRPRRADGGGLWLARRLTRELDLVREPAGFTVRLWA